MSNFYTTKQAADILHVTPATVARWCKRRVLKAHKAGAQRGGEWHIDSTSVEALAAERQRTLVCVDCGTERGAGAKIALCRACQTKRNNARPLRKEGKQ